MTEIDAIIQSRIDEFRQGLTEFESEKAVKRYIIHQAPYILDESLYFNLRMQIAEFFGVHFTDVIMVGSGKLGFSIKPSRRFQPFYDASDIDMAIIAPIKFQKIWTDINRYVEEVKYWPDHHRYKKYLSRGWLWDYLLPSSPLVPIKQDWWSFFQELTAKEEYGKIRIKAGLYYSWDFLETYQLKCVRDCKTEIAS